MIAIRGLTQKKYGLTIDAGNPWDRQQSEDTCSSRSLLRSLRMKLTRLMMNAELNKRYSVEGLLT
jgi:hypothetical protein